MEMHAARERRRANALEERRALLGARAIVQLEVGADVGEPLGHAENRGDADAAGDQQRALGAVGELEMVSRLADLEHVAFLHLVVHRRGAAARIRDAQHADQVAMRLARIVAQRILAHEPVARCRRRCASPR